MKLGESADTGGNEKKPKVCVRGKGEEEREREGSPERCNATVAPRFSSLHLRQRD